MIFAIAIIHTIFKITFCPPDSDLISLCPLSSMIDTKSSMLLLLADLLSIENQDITLIDTDKEVLNFAETHLDIFSIRGDASSVEVLERPEVHKARLFIAVTTSEQTNLLASIIAKKMGAKQTIARVNKSEYIRQNGKIINFKEVLYEFN